MVVRRLQDARPRELKPVARRPGVFRLTSWPTFRIGFGLLFAFVGLLCYLLIPNEAKAKDEDCSGLFKSCRARPGNLDYVFGGIFGGFGILMMLLCKYRRTVWDTKAQVVRLREHYWWLWPFSVGSCVETHSWRFGSWRAWRSSRIRTRRLATNTSLEP